MPRPPLRRGLPCLALLALLACRDDATAPPAAGPVDVARSEVRVSLDTVESGRSATLTLRTIDTRGRPLTAGGRQVTFAAAGGLSTGRIGVTTDRGNGTYEATFTGVLAGAATTIHATIDGAPVTSPLPVIAVRPGAWSATTSRATVSPRTILAGGAALIEFIARDSAGNRLERGGRRVAFRPAGGTASGIVGPVTDHGDGRYTSPFTGGSVGTPLAVVTLVDDIPLATATPSISVARGISPELSVLSVPHDTLSIEAGVRVTLQVRDSADVPRTSGGDTVTFVVGEEDGGDGVIEDLTDHDDGTYSATLRGTRAGLLSLSAHINGRHASSRDRWIAVQARRAAPQRSSIRVSRSLLVAGDTTTLIAELRDADGAVIDDGTVPVQFTASEEGSARGAIGPARYEGDGQFVATFRATRAGAGIVIGAIVDDSARIEMLDSSGTSHLPTIEVVPGPASSARSSIEVSRARVSIGDSALVRVVARDGEGNVIPGGGLAVEIRRTGGNGVSSGSMGTVRATGDGSYTAWYVAAAAGKPDTLKASIGGAALTSGLATITVGTECRAGPPSVGHARLTINDTSGAPSPVTVLTIPSGLSTTLTLQLNDARGCAVTEPHHVAFVATGGTSTASIGTVTNLGDGRYTATFTGAVAGSAMSIVASVDQVPVTTPPVQVTVAPGDISTHRSLLHAARTTLAAGDSVAITLTARDAADNRLATGGHVVTFSVPGASPGGVLRAVVDNGDGTYTATYVARIDGATDTIVARIEGTAVQSRLTMTIGTPATARPAAAPTP